MILTNEPNLLRPQSHIVLRVAVLQTLFHVKVVGEDVGAVDKGLQRLVELGIHGAMELDRLPHRPLRVLALPAEIAQLFVNLERKLKFS